MYGSDIHGRYLQLYEQEFNFISMYIRLKIKESKTLEEKEYWYFDFINTINIRQYNFEKKFYDNLSEENKIQFMKEAEEKIYIHQEPFYNDTDFTLLQTLYDKYDFVKPFKFEGINIPLVMGELYFIKLKHDAKSKMSARSTGFENLKSAPSKDKAYKYKKAPISRTPIRIGNMELLYLLLTSDKESVSNLVETYSINEDAKEKLLEALLIGDPYDINVDLNDVGKNENKKIIDTLLFNLSLILEDEDDNEDK